MTHSGNGFFIASKARVDEAEIIVKFRIGGGEFDCFFDFLGSKLVVVRVKRGEGEVDFGATFVEIKVRVVKRFILINCLDGAVFEILDLLGSDVISGVEGDGVASERFGVV